MISLIFLSYAIHSAFYDNTLLSSLHLFLFDWVCFSIYWSTPHSFHFYAHPIANKKQLTGLRLRAVPSTNYNYSNPPIDKNNGANTNDTIVISLIRMLIDGPDVSLNGSPTVSPTTAAL